MKGKIFSRRLWGRIVMTILLSLISITLIDMARVKAADDDVEVVIVIDTSGSMKSSDPEKVAVDGAKLFIDMMSLEGSSVAVVPFSDTIGDTIPMTSVESIDSRDQIKADIDSIKYTGDTDIGLALKTAYSLFDFNKEDSKVIVFFTDGKIDLGNKRVRTDDDSLQDVRDIVRQAKEDNVSIYSIGLSVNDSIDEQLLSDIALNTEGRSFLISNADDLPKIFDEIFADYIESKIISVPDIVLKGDEPEEVEFTIDNNSAMEANVVLLTSMKLTDVDLVDPNGNDLSKLTNVFVEKSANYTLFKIISPSMGTWKMRITGKKGCRVHVNLILNYQVELRSDAVLQDSNGESFIHVSSWLDKEGSKLSDEDLMKSFQAKVEYTYSKKVYSQAMTYKNDSFVSDIPVDDMSGEIGITCIIENDTMYRKSDPIVISLPDKKVETPNGVPYFSGLPKEINLDGLILNMQKEKLDLNDYVVDPEGDEFTIEVASSDEEIASAEVKKSNTLLIKAVSKGEANIEVVVTDVNGGMAQESIRVSCQGKFANVLPLLGCIGALAVLVAVIVILKKEIDKKNKRLYGRIEWEIGRGSIPKRFAFEYEKGKFVLSNAIQGEMCSLLGLDKIYICMNSKGDGIVVENKSSKCKITNEYGEEKKVLDIGGSQYFIVCDKTDNLQNRIRIRYYEA